MASSLLIFLAAALGAEAVGTVIGFGSSTILVPVAAIIFDIRTAIGLAGLLHFFGVAFKFFLWRGSVNWRIVASFSFLGVIFSFLGAYLISFLPAETVTRVLGVFLVAYSLYSLTGHRLSLPRRSWVMAGAGGLDGFLAGLIGTAGALRTAFLSAFKLPKNEFLGTSFATAFFIDITRVGVYVGSGILKFDPGFWAAILAVAVGGSLLGRKVVFKLPEGVFYRAVYLALFLAGIKFILG